MSTGSVTPEDVYNEILAMLNQLGASDVITAIRTTVARGVVLDSNELPSGKSLRPMNGMESLAVALEHIISVLEVPSMVESVSQTFDAQEVLWMPEATTIGLDSMVGPSIDDGMRDELQRSLKKVAQIAKELGISLPEVA